jgi:hypothetical protein
MMAIWPSGEYIDVQTVLERLRANPHFDLRRMAEVDVAQLLAALTYTEVVIAFRPDGGWSFPKGEEKIDTDEARTLRMVSVRVANALQAELLRAVVLLIKRQKWGRRRAPGFARLLAWAADDPNSMQNDIDRHIRGFEQHQRKHRPRG